MHDRSPDARNPDELLREVSWLRRLARTLVADPATADDLMGDTLAAWSAMRTPVHSHRGWLATVLRHFAERHHRREARRRRAENEASAPRLARATDESLATAELHRNLVDAVLALDEPYRSPIVLRFLDELPLHAVAQRLDVPVETARTRIRRGLDKLRSRLDERHGGRAAWAALVEITAAPAPLVPALGILMTIKILSPVVVVVLAIVAWFSLREQALPPTTDTAAPGRVADVTTARIDEPLQRMPAVVTGTAETSPGRAVTITGRVLEEGTRLPIDGVAVRHVAASSLLSAKVPPAEAATGVDGRFVLVAIVPERIPTTLLLCHATHARTTLELRSAEESSSDLDLGEIEMPPGTVVNGTVFDADGALAARAALFVCRGSFWTEAGRIVRLDEAAAIGRARDDGTFELDERLVPNRPAPLLIAACDRGLGFTDLEELQRADARIRADVHLLPSAAVRVRAVDPEHGPVAGATIVGEPRFLPLRLPGTHPVFVERVPGLALSFVRQTDADGRATLRLPVRRDSPSTQYTLRADAAGRDTTVVTVELPHDEEVELLLARRRELVVTGRVVDTDGRGIAGATVRARWADERSTASDADGAFRVAVARGQGPLTVEARAENTFPARQTMQPGALDTSSAISLVLAPAVVLHGQVTDQNGRAVVRAHVWLDDVDTAIETDGYGEFRGPIRADRPILVRVSPPAPDSAWDGPIDHVVAAGQREVALTLTRRAEGRATLDARVLDASGAPLDGQRAVLCRDGAVDGLQQPATATIGRVTAASLSPGTWTLRVVPAHGCEVFTRFTVSADGERIEPLLQQSAGVAVDGEVRFEPADQMPRRVTLGFANVSQGAHFVAREGQAPNEGRSSLTLDPASGASFRIEDVDPSRPLVVVASAENAGGRSAWSAGAANAPMTIVVRPLATIRLTSSTPLHGALLLQLRRPGEEWDEPIRYLGLAGQVKSFEHPVLAGTFEWRLRVPTRGADNHGGAAWQSGAFTVSPGARTEIAVR
jgi:RNA polymerase sigma-70 factor (ECF subfamily)